MLRAKNFAGEEIIPALLMKEEIDALRRGDFYCPDCLEKVMIRAGEKVTPHFAHYRKSTCSLRSIGGEGEYHYQGKLLLYQWLQNQGFSPHLEKYLPQINQRPDIYFKSSKSEIALEFQCASVPATELIKRNHGYSQIRILPIWMLGNNQLHRLSNYTYRVKAFFRPLIIQLSTRLPTTFIFFCPKRKLFILLHDLYYIHDKRLLALTTVKSLQSTTIKELIPRSFFPKDLLCAIWNKEKRQFRLQQAQAYGKELTWRKWLYHKGLYLEKLPSYIFLPIKLQYQMKVPLWQWQSYLLLNIIHPTGIGAILTIERSVSEITPFVWSEFKQNATKIVGEYFDYLCKLNLISRINNRTWIKNREIIFPRHIEEAIKEDEKMNKLLFKN